jgi:DNA-binding FadR family transcriptional regulator
MDHREDRVLHPTEGGVVPSSRKVSGAFTQSEIHGRARSTSEAISDALRESILRGELCDGDVLPGQDDLMSTFSASKPSVRGALRILESEGLIRVRRGRLGGAIVNAPKVDHAARAVEMILRAREVGIDDVASALQSLEPMCAAMCARRPDRSVAVLPQLRQLHAESVQSLDDPAAFAILSRRFHEALVSCCGNETVSVVLGAVEAIWSAYTWGSASDSQNNGGTCQHPVFDADVRARSLTAHEYLIMLIERGDEEGALREARHHWTGASQSTHDFLSRLQLTGGIPESGPPADEAGSELSER